MSKPIQKDDSLEIIELATDSIEELAKAFDLITEVCESFTQQPQLELSEETDAPTIH